jgi:thiol-disulfide isomerase/thioredoxin
MRTQRLNRFVVLLALAAGGWTNFSPQAVAGGIKVGDTLPDLTAVNLEGKLPDTLKGKVVLLDFWASWCDPCKESFPAMEELEKQYGPRGLVIIAVNVDENQSDMQDFLKTHNASFTVVRDAKQKLVAAAGIATMPSSFLVDSSGTVRFVHAGFHGEQTKKEYRQEIEALLGK